MTTKLHDDQRARHVETYGRSLQLYDGGKVHDVTKAINFLRSRVMGFFVLAPLDWGMGSELSGDLSKVSTVDIG
jgi:hypothetical protein